MRRFSVIVFSVLVSVALALPASAQNDISVVSFNIQFLGHFKKRDNAALADLLAPHDLVIVQELVAPPYAPPSKITGKPGRDSGCSASNRHR